LDNHYENITGSFKNSDNGMVSQKPAQYPNLCPNCLSQETFPLKLVLVVDNIKISLHQWERRKERLLLPLSSVQRRKYEKPKVD